jgi:hypothetical protein
MVMEANKKKVQLNQCRYTKLYHRDEVFLNSYQVKHCSPAPFVLVEVVKYYAAQSFIIVSVAVFQHLFTKAYSVRETQPNQSN